MAADRFLITKSTDPADSGASVTPSDSVDLDATTRAIYVGGDGDVSVVMKAGGTLVFKGVTAGTFMPIRVTRVNDTDTTATDLVALF